MRDLERRLAEAGFRVLEDGELMTMSNLDLLTVVRNAQLLEDGSSLRYPTDFYLALRDGLLDRRAVAHDSFDGAELLGEATVPYAWFTSGVGEDGLVHAFFVAGRRTEVAGQIGSILTPDQRL